MGIMTREQGQGYVIASDRNSGDSPTNRPPKKVLPEVYEVWAGDHWSATMTEATIFNTLDEADEYVRANFAHVTGQR